MHLFKTHKNELECFPHSPRKPQTLTTVSSEIYGKKKQIKERESERGIVLIVLNLTLSCSSSFF